MTIDLKKEKYSRQFFGGTKPVDLFEDWKKLELPNEDFFVYAHPLLDLSFVSSKDGKNHLILLGYAINYSKPDYNNQQVAAEIMEKSHSREDFIKNIADLAGRFICVLIIEGKKFVMHDMCGTRTVYYSREAGQVYLASQPKLLSEKVALEKGDRYETYVNSKHYNEDIEYWLPCGITPYDNVEQLVPNHYLDLQEVKQVRFWPFEKIKKQNPDDSTKLSVKMLQTLIEAAKKRFNLAFSLTAGWDSRIILALSRKWLPDFFIYTHQMRKMDLSSPDIIIPQVISRKLGFDYRVLDCQMEVDDKFRELYQSSSDLPHEDWMKIANGLYMHYPMDRVLLGGNISEIARCSLYKDGHHDEVISPDQLAVDWPEWREIPFILDYMGNWLKEAKEICRNYNIDIFDLWYMELFMGGWLTRNYNESDVVYEKFTPYNFRPWVVKMWGVPVKYRLHDHPVIYKKILERCWPALLYWPINPPHWNRKFRMKYFIADKLKKIGLFKTGRAVYNKLHPVYMKIKS
jgi:hypothetical protein